jgi:hypothetical protein
MGGPLRPVRDTGDLLRPGPDTDNLPPPPHDTGDLLRARRNTDVLRPVPDTGGLPSVRRTGDLLRPFRVIPCSSRPGGLPGFLSGSMVAEAKHCRQLRGLQANMFA